MNDRHAEKDPEQAIAQRKSHKMISDTDARYCHAAKWRKLPAVILRPGKLEACSTFDDIPASFSR
jgi:hypothetical protein